MYITITKWNKPIRMEQPIDNSLGNLTIGLKSITMWVGYFNIKKRYRFKWSREGKEKNTNIEAGLYSFQELAQVFTDAVPGLMLDVNKTNGLIELIVPENISIQIPQDVRNLIGLDDSGWLDEGIYSGDHAVNFLPKIMHVNLEELSTTNNIVDGKPSQLLELVPLSSNEFGYSSTVQFPVAHYKRLQPGVISEFNFKLFISGKELDNHSQPIYLTLEIK